MPTSYGTCVVHKWFYEPRRNELACACEINAVMNSSGLLRQGNRNSRAIPGIHKDSFNEGYILKIWTDLEHLKTVRDLVSKTAKAYYLFT
ncbi:unnamed protein product [Dicrocoelium dendriticum]|nr:unnamed protein product [Dicrocoelium dendriticum]